MLPEVNRQVAVRWLAELAGRTGPVDLVAGDAPGSSGEGAAE
ncbi:hypothetical protein [Streptomyces sp. NPDC052036]